MRHRRPTVWKGGARICVAVLALLFLTEVAGAGEVPFASESVISNGDTFSVVAADVDGDGDRDVFSIAQGYVVSWHENTAGDGSAWTTHTIRPPEGGAVGWSIFAADVDGDGDLDALSSSLADVAWYENLNGDGSAWTTHIVDAGIGHHHSVRTADIDRDGDLDIVAPTYSDVAWYENTAGDGSAWTRHVVFTATATEDHFHGASPADLDGDGDQDILTVSFQPCGVSWHENTAGDGSAWTARAITALTFGRSVSAADMDGDGDLDAVVSGGGYVLWYENTAGDGSAWSVHAVDLVDPGDIQSVFLADLDADGDQDLLFGDNSGDRVAWAENTAGDGSTWTEHEVSDSVDGPLSVSGGDLDGDGDLELIAGSSEADRLIWFENETIHRSARYPEKRVISTGADGAWSVDSADVDRDGDLDVLSASYYDREIAWHENQGGSAPTWSGHTIHTDTRAATCVVAADIDADGDLDALSTFSQDRKVSWFENPSWTEHVISTDGSETYRVLGVDFDSDGDVDVLATYFVDGKLVWYENPGGGGPPWTEHTISTAVPWPYTVHAGDVNGDGDPDVLSGSYGTRCGVFWYDAGSAWAERTISTSFCELLAVLAADVDGDGDLDAVGAGYGDDEIAWFENTTGTGLAWTEHVISVSADGASSLGAADVDRDGDLDVISTSMEDDTIAWYENDGTPGGLGDWDAHVVVTDAEFVLSAIVADVETDGDLDILSASHGDDTIAWYENCGGQFALATTDTAPAQLDEGQVDDLLRIAVNHNGRIGDTDLELATVELLFEETAGDPLGSTEANALIERLEIYLDDGSGVFEGSDLLVTTVEELSLGAGIQTVVLADGDPNARVAHGTPRTFFVVVELTADARAQPLRTLRVGHVTDSSSTAEDRDHDIPLVLECVPSVSSRVVGIPRVAAGAVPDGHTVPGTPLTVAKEIAGDDLILSWGASCSLWDASCSAIDDDYAIYEGSVGDFTSHREVTCSTAGATTATIEPEDGDRYYLVVPQSINAEGSYGREYDGTERSQGLSACLPQTIGECRPPVAPSDLCEDALPIAPGSTVVGSTINASGPDLIDWFACQVIDGPGVWYSVTGTGNTITASTCDTADFDTKILVLAGGCDPDQIYDVDCNDDMPGCSGFTSEVSWCSQTGTEYLILIHGFMAATGNFCLTVADDGEPCTTRGHTTFPARGPATPQWHEPGSSLIRSPANEISPREPTPHAADSPWKR